MWSLTCYYCNRYRTWDVTLSLVVSKAHFNILNWFSSRGMEYTKRYRGIYTLHGISLLKVQIVITEDIDAGVFQWLSALTDKLTEEKARSLVTAAHNLTEDEDRRLAEAVMQVLTSANGKVFEKMKEDNTMASALMELMKPEVEKYAEDKVKEAYTEQARIMLRHGENNEYIKLLTHLTDQEIEALRQVAQ